MSAMTVPIGRRAQGKHYQQSVVLAKPTSSRYLVIHRATDTDPEWPDWTITHTITGYAFIRHLPSATIARLVAAVLARQLPVSNHHVGRINDAEREMEPTVRAWLLDWRRQ